MTERTTTVERRVVNDRVFLLGLDELYRRAMKKHERYELRPCARRVAEVLHVEPANVPIEGYYTEHPELTEYFRLVRALQGVSGSARPAVEALPEFQRLLQVTSSPLFGRAVFSGTLLPQGVSPLSEALSESFPDWTVSRLTEKARAIASAGEDFSLVGLAARIGDAVVLTATRETVVLYERVVDFGQPVGRPAWEYVWEVDEALARLAKRFVDTFNALFDEQLPAPDPAHARDYWTAKGDDSIVGRCVRIGIDDRTTPPRHYHWAIRRTSQGSLAVEDFWRTEPWTTQDYRRALAKGEMGMDP